MALVRKGERDLSSVLRPVAQSVRADEILINLFVPAVESPLPLAVVDDEGRLLGVIPRVTLLAALGPGPGATGEITVPVIPLPTTEIDQVLAETATRGDASSEQEVR